MSNAFTPKYMKVTIVMDDGETVTTIRVPRAKNVMRYLSNQTPLSADLVVSLTAEYDSVADHIMTEAMSTTPKEQPE